MAIVPIRAAGVAREFATSIHGEINPDVGSHLLNHQAGRDGELALMGVDGIVVAREVDIAPQPSSEWELVVSTDEGNVFHRRSAPFSRVRSVTSIDSRPNEQFAAPFVYLVVTGGFPYTVLMLLLLVALLAIKSLAETRSILSVVPMLFGVALGFGLSAPAWLAILDLVQGSARELQPARAHWQWLVPPASLPGLILPCWTVNWADFSNRYLPHTATELACGLVAPAALIAGLAWRGRVLVRQIKWELVLLLLVLLLSMIPTAGLFRWSFRWLPFFHLVLAICAAEALHLRPGSPIAATAALVLTAGTAIAMLMLRTSWLVRFPADVDLSWARDVLVSLGGRATRF